MSFPFQLTYYVQHDSASLAAHLTSKRAISCFNDKVFKPQGRMAPLVNVQLLAEGFEWPLRHLEQEATSSARAKDGTGMQRHKTGSMVHLAEHL